MESRLVGGNLLGLGVAVEDGGDLVLEHEGHGHHALRAAPEPRHGLARARGLRDVATRGLLAAVDVAEDRVGGQGEVDRLHRVGALEAARVPADGVRALHDEHRGAVGVARHLVHEVGQHLGEARALLDGGEGSAQLAETRGRRGRLGVLDHDLDHGRADLVLVDPLVVAGDRLLQLIERADEVGLMVANGALDLDDPVRHLPADEGEGLCLQLVFEGHL